MSTTEVDISKIQPGQGIKVSWRKQPVFVRYLTPKEIAEANAVPLSSLRDPQTLAERTKPGKHELADHARRLHAPWLHPARASARARTAVLTAAISAPATVRSTTLRRGSGRDRRRRTSSFRTTNLHRRRRSRSARRGSERMSFSWAKPYEPKHPLMRWLDERLPLPRLVYGAVGGGYPVPRNLNYWWNFGVARRALPDDPDRHRHRSCDALHCVRPTAPSIRSTSSSCATSTRAGCCATRT